MACHVRYLQCITPTDSVTETKQKRIRTVTKENNYSKQNKDIDKVHGFLGKGGEGGVSVRVKFPERNLCTIMEWLVTALTTDQQKAEQQT